MDNKQLDKLAADDTMLSTFSIHVSVQNGRVSPEMRRLIANTVARHAKGLMVQLEMLCPERTDVMLDHHSSLLGKTEIPLEDEDAA